NMSFFNRILCHPWFAVCLGVFVLALDCATKYFTQLYLPLRSLISDEYPYGGIGIFKNFLGIEFSFVHQTNRGAAWGILAEYQQSLLFVRIAFVIGLIAYLFLSHKNPLWRLPFTLIIVG